METSNTEKHLINTYVSDMVALLQHVSQPLDGQIEIAQAPEFAEAAALIQRIKSTTTAQQNAFEAHLKTIGGSADHGIKSAWSAFLGIGAGAVNATRSTKLSKGLRDDYTALNLAAVSSTMLHATAVGVGDQATAQLAKQGLGAIAPLVIEISRAMPAIVLQELKADGENVAISAAEFSEQTTQAAWKN